jgi:hypothetical protein
MDGTFRSESPFPRNAHLLELRAKLQLHQVDAGRSELREALGNTYNPTTAG